MGHAERLSSSTVRTKIIMILHRRILPADSVICSVLAVAISKGKVVYSPGQTEKPTTDDDAVHWQPRKDKIEYLHGFGMFYLRRS